MPLVILFVILMVWFYCAFNVVKSWGIALAMIIIGCLAPLGLLALALNIAWYFYKQHKGTVNPLSS